MTTWENLRGARAPGITPNLYSPPISDAQAALHYVSPIVAFSGCSFSRDSSASGSHPHEKLGSFYYVKQQADAKSYKGIYHLAAYICTRYVLQACKAPFYVCDLKVWSEKKKNTIWEKTLNIGVLGSIYCVCVYFTLLLCFWGFGDLILEHEAMYWKKWL